MNPVLSLARQVSNLTVTEPIDLEERYKFVKEISDEYKCVICSKLLREPQVTGCCGQHFCQYCLEQWLKTNHEKPCPYCRTPNCNYIRYLPMKREIYELKVYCPNLYCPSQILGCLTLSTLQQIDGHLKICEFEEVNCSCNKKFIRKEFTNHQQNHCPKRTVQCQYCHESGIYEVINSAHHQNTCPDFPINCPKECGAYGIKRKNLGSHKKKCPLELVECKYFKAGCHDKICRRDYDAHERDNVQQHLQITMESFTRLSTEHNKVKKEHTQLKKQHNDLKKEHSQLKLRTPG